MPVLFTCGLLNESGDGEEAFVPAAPGAAAPAKVRRSCEAAATVPKPVPSVRTAKVPVAIPLPVATVQNELERTWIAVPASLNATAVEPELAVWFTRIVPAVPKPELLK